MAATMSKSAPARVLIIDDHPIVRSSLHELISAQSDMEICAETGSLSEASEYIAREAPDIALVDIRLEAGNGLDLVERMATPSSRTKFVMFSALHDAILVEKAKATGAVGYVSKQSPLGEILEAIRAVRKNRQFFPSVPQASLEDAEKSAIADGVSKLTRRERQVYELVGEGIGTAAIAERLSLSVKTIETHKENIKKKLGLSSANELIRHAMRWMMAF